MALTEKLTAIADAIREKTGGTDGLTLEGMAAEIDDVYDAGKQAEYDAFWDAYQKNGLRTEYVNAFHLVGWNAVTFNPKYDIICKGNTYGAFAYSHIEDTRRTIDVRESTNLTNLFYYAVKLKTVRNLRLCANTPFGDTTFAYCSNLENLNIEGVIGQSGLDVHWATALSKQSMESIVNALSEATSGLTVTLSLTAVNNAFETEAGLADGSTSEQWQTLIGTRSNWTISLV